MTEQEQKALYYSVCVLVLLNNIIYVCFFYVWQQHRHAMRRINNIEMHLEQYRIHSTYRKIKK